MPTPARAVAIPMPTVGAAARKPPRYAMMACQAAISTAWMVPDTVPPNPTSPGPLKRQLDGRLAGHATFERSRQLADEPLAWDRHLPGNAWPLVNHPANLGDDRVV